MKLNIVQQFFKGTISPKGKGIYMLRSGDAVRLTNNDKSRLESLMGGPIEGVTTVADLNRRITSAQAAHENGTLEGRLLSALLEQEKIQS